MLGRDEAHEGAEAGQHGNRLLVAVHLGETGEAAQVDEREVATNSHSNSLAGAGAADGTIRAGSQTLRAEFAAPGNKVPQV